MIINWLIGWRLVTHVWSWHNIQSHHTRTVFSTVFHIIGHAYIWMCMYIYIISPKVSFISIKKTSEGYKCTIRKCYVQRRWSKQGLGVMNSCSKPASTRYDSMPQWWNGTPIEAWVRLDRSRVVGWIRPFFLSPLLSIFLIYPYHMLTLGSRSNTHSLTLIGVEGSVVMK